MLGNILNYHAGHNVLIPSKKSQKGFLIIEDRTNSIFQQNLDLRYLIFVVGTELIWLILQILSVYS